MSSQSLKVSRMSCELMGSDTPRCVKSFDTGWLSALQLMKAFPPGTNIFTFCA